MEFFSEKLMNFVLNLIQLLNLRGVTSKKWYNSYEYSDKWTNWWTRRDMFGQQL